jgi:hypothetical protein
VDQTPRHILQDAFGHIRVEFITRDLGGKEAVSRGHGAAQVHGMGGIFPGRWEREAWVVYIWEGIKV